MANLRWIVPAAVGVALVTAACGGSKSAAKTAPTTPAASGTAQGGRGFRGGTPPPAVLTSIAEGTPRAFGGGTPPPAVLTSIAEGTPRAFGGGTPPPDVQTAIAEGTPAGSFRGNGGRGRVLPAVAALLSIDEAQLQAELDAAGATIARVAAAHDVDRGSVRRALIDAQVQRLNDSVAAGRMTQADADAARSQFEANVDNLLDSNGSEPSGQPAPAP
jgi:hypothetical protein